MALKIESPSFDDGSELPTAYTCDADGRSPPLRWSGVPDGTRSLALIIEDPDAPDPAAPRKPFVHWLLYDIPPSTTELPQGAGPGELPSGTRAGQNDHGGFEYYPPCPPIGRHRYYHTLYALDIELGEQDRLSRSGFLGAIEGHVLDKAELVGLYAKS
jgi:Raf kinase inhibitor-like YbhB/YbcL family protein